MNYSENVNYVMKNVSENLCGYEGKSVFDIDFVEKLKYYISAVVK